jgi:hypothetical protein
VYKQILISEKFKNWKERSNNRVNWEKSTKEPKIRIRL